MVEELVGTTMEDDQPLLSIQLMNLAFISQIPFRTHRILATITDGLDMIDLLCTTLFFIPLDNMTSEWMELSRLTCGSVNNSNWSKEPDQIVFSPFVTEFVLKLMLILYQNGNRSYII